MKYGVTVASVAFILAFLPIRLLACELPAASAYQDISLKTLDVSPMRIKLPTLCQLRPNFK